MNKERLAAFTDAIIAIAATIMVLELHVPEYNNWESLADNWTVFLAYIISFTLIYTVWLSHHNLFEKAEIISVRTFLLNGFWLFLVTLVPFTTSWIGRSPDSLLAEIIYDSVLLLWSFAFHLLDREILKDNPAAARDSSTRLIDRSLIYGTYALGIAIAFISPIYSLYFIAIMSAISTVRMITAN